MSLVRHWKKNLTCTVR